NGLGRTHYQIGNFSEAVTAFSTAFALNSTSAEIQSNIALCHYRLGEYGKAMEAINEALRKEPANNVIRVNAEIITSR
ncbi:MAG: tetratricopeptide repeat protein, partial [Spirochaetota bacterium]